jgi:hypothetical protein
VAVKIYNVKMDVFWVVAPCSLVEVYQRFRGPYCLHHQRPEDIHLHTHRRENLKSYICNTVVWVLTLSSPVGGLQHFGGTHHLHLQDTFVP